MMINRNNYETWFLDFAEGKLDAGSRELVIRFMEQNPDLARELQDYQEAGTLASHLTCPSRENLKKEKYEDEELFEAAAFDLTEGNMEEAEESLFRSWLANRPDHQRQVFLFETSKLIPDPGIQFPGRDALKKKSPGRAIMMSFLAAAAMLILALVLFFPGKNTYQPVSLVSENQETKKITPSTPASKQESIPVTRKPDDPIKINTREQKTPALRENPATGTSRQDRLPVSPARPLLARNTTLTVKDGQVAGLAPVMQVAGLAQAKSQDDIPLSQYLDEKLKKLKAERNGKIFTREELRLTGLRLLSKLPGKKLTGRKGDNGRILSVEFNTQLLAVSVPVNEEM